MTSSPRFRRNKRYINPPSRRGEKCFQIASMLTSGECKMIAN